MIRVYLIGRLAERERLNWLQETILQPAGIKVASYWHNLPFDSDDVLTEKDSRDIAEANFHALVESNVAVYQPSYVPSAGRMVEVGLAHALGKPVIVLGVNKWEELGWFDRTLYLRDAIYCKEETDLVNTIEKALCVAPVATV